MQQNWRQKSLAVPFGENVVKQLCALRSLFSIYVSVNVDLAAESGPDGELRRETPSAMCNYIS